jgi:hypothetical protein
MCRSLEISSTVGVDMVARFGLNHVRDLAAVAAYLHNHRNSAEFRLLKQRLQSAENGAADAERAELMEQRLVIRQACCRTPKLFPAGTVFWFAPPATAVSAAAAATEVSGAAVPVFSVCSVSECFDEMLLTSGMLSDHLPVLHDEIVDRL